MICELQMKLCGRLPLLYDSNHNVYEIERVCDYRDRYMLFAAYTRFAVNSAEKKKTIDSRLIDKKFEASVSIRRSSTF